MTLDHKLDQIEKDVTLSDQLAQIADGWIDLTRPTTEGEYLMTGLAKRYEDLMLPFASLAGEGGASQTLLITLLIKQLARAQADIFALKSAVLGKDQLVLTRDWDFRDPLLAYSQSLGEAAAMMPDGSFDRFRLPIDESVIGFGWHDVERSDERIWRWSGPGLTSSLVLPKLFKSKAALSVEISLLRPSILPKDNFILVDRQPVGYELEFKEGSDTELTVRFDVETPPTSPFFMVSFNVAKTLSPSDEWGSTDTRELGICLNKIEFVAQG